MTKQELLDSHFVLDGEYLRIGEATREQLLDIVLYFANEQKRESIQHEKEMDFMDFLWRKF